MKPLWEIASSLWRFIDQRDQLLIVSLHRIDRPQGLPLSIVEKSLRFLADRYRFVLPDELRHRDVRGKMAMLTVDDGHAEVYSVLYPMIRSLNIRMVVCVTTDFFLRNRWLWFDKVRWILEQPGLDQRLQSYTLPGQTSVFENPRYLSKFFKSLPADTRDELINGLAQHCELNVPTEPSEGFRPVRAHEVQDMLESRAVELASHTVTHPILMNLSDEALEFELRHSKKELEDFSGRRIHSFCYPNGLPGDFDARTMLAVNDAGYGMAFSSIEGVNYKNNLAWDQLKRIHIHRTPHIFKRGISGLTEVIGRLKHL